MKRNPIILLAALSLGLAFSASAQQMPPIPIDEAVRIGKLDNGLTYYIRHNEEPEGQASFYIAQKVGSILEEDNQRGLAHFLEHMCFNGTQNFPGNSLVSYLESIGVKFGAQLNAYTSIDETVYNIDNVPVAAVPESIDSCLLILHDWAGALQLSDEEIDKERGVIHEEWRSRRSAQDRMFEVILPKIYPGNKYAYRLPIGTMDVIDNFPYEVLRNYYHTWYRPDQQGIVVVGDVDVDLIEAKIHEIFASLPAKAADAPERVYTPIENNDSPIIATASDKENPNAISYIFLKHEVVPFEAKSNLDYLLLNYAKEMLSTMASFRINEMTQAADPDFLDAGIFDDEFFLSKTCDALCGIALYDESQMLRGLTSIYREMLRIVRNGFTASEYERARTEYLSALETRYNQREKKSSSSYCSEYVRHFIDNEPIPGIETEYALMNQLAPNLPVELVNELVKQLVPTGGKNLVVVNMLPEKDGLTYPSDDEILAALQAVEAEDIAPYVEEVIDRPLVSKLRKQGKVKKTSSAEFGFTKYLLSNGVEVYFKQTDYNKDEVLFRAFSQGGTSLYPDEDLPTLRALGDLVEIGGLGDFSTVELTKALAGKQVRLNASIGGIEEGLSGSSTPKDLETLFQLNYLYFTSLRKDAEAFASWQTKTATSLKNAEAQPTKAFSDSLTVNMWSNPERGQSLQYSDLEKVDYDRALVIAKERFSNAADFKFIIVGNISEDELLPLLTKYLASLPGKSKKESYEIVNGYKRGERYCEFEKAMQNPFVINYFNYIATDEDYSLRNRLTAELLGSSLELILHEEIREKEGGTYGIFAMAGVDPTPYNATTLTIVYQTDPARYQYLNNRIDEILAEFAVSGPRAIDVEKTKTNLHKDHAVELKENKYWLGAMRSYLKYGVNDVDAYDEILDSITSEDIITMFDALIHSGDTAKVIMVGVE
ncbi:MAG: M16 family metallopeptidase [Candidatus Cryptobacteroides sp.]